MIDVWMFVTRSLFVKTTENILMKLVDYTSEYHIGYNI